MPSEQLKFVPINDFRPGIIDSIRHGVGDTGSTLELPPGAATKEGTFDCIANATGQLVPLPSHASYATVGTFGDNPVATNQIVATGITCVGPIKHLGQTHSDDIHLYLQYMTGGGAVGHQHVVDHGGTGFVEIETQLAAGGPVFVRRGITSVVTRGRRTAFFDQPGFPVVISEQTIGNVDPYTDGMTAYYSVYPDPSNLSSGTSFQFASVVDNGAKIYGGQLVAHSGRIIRLCENSTDHGPATKFLTNELIRFGDPPGNVDITEAHGSATDSILDPQYPGGYGSWGSISFGELLLVKKYGGALLVEGDIYAPQVTRLPGVVSTGNLVNVAAFSPAGLIYCVENDGAYLWAGGSTSQKISKQSDTFHKGQTTFNWGIQVGQASWYDWVVFTNGWLFDAITGGWWRLSSPTTNLDGSPCPLHWWSAGMGTPRYLYGVTAHKNGFNTVEIIRYDRATPVSNYKWTSQPIMLSPTQTCDIREVEISVANTPPTGLNQITIIVLDDVNELGLSFTTGPIAIGHGDGTSYRMRVPFSGRVNGSCRVRINVDCTDGPAFTVNYVILGYSESGPLQNGGSNA